MASDIEIVKLIREGDMVAFRNLFQSIYTQLYIHCRKYISDPEDAKDIIQNVFLHFWEKRKDIDIHTSLYAYLQKSVQNECLNYLRTHRIANIPQEDIPVINQIDIAEKNDPQSEFNINEIERIIENTIETLPDQCKFVFKLSRIEGLKNKEIADKLQISVRTVDTHIYRALKILKVRLVDYLS